MSINEARQKFRSHLKTSAQWKLGQIEQAVSGALLSDDGSFNQLKADRAEVVAAIDWVNSEAFATAPGEELPAHWPALLGEIPLWLSDPAAAAVADPPGPPCVVNCSMSG